jgi:hypothetical protein
MTATWPPVQRDGKSAPFFDAAARGRVAIRRCSSCGRHSPPEAVACAHCGGLDLTWAESDGPARLVSWTVVHRAPNPVFAELVPYTVGIVELAEGPWLYARIADDEPSTLHAGLPLHAEFEPAAEGAESYPVFVRTTEGNR